MQTATLSPTGVAPESTLLDDRRAFLKAIHDHGLDAKLDELKQPSVLRAMAALAFDWTLILAAFLACAMVSWWLLPIALFVIGNRQMALNIMLHEASHKNLARSGRVNNWLGEWLCALPSLASLVRYRRSHILHHRYLGDAAADPDHLVQAPGRESWLRYWAGMVCSRVQFSQSVFGSLFEMTYAELAKVLAWFVGASLVLSLVVGVEDALCFTPIWFLARIVAYHPVRMFREMSDHYGLTASNWLQYTRNVEGNALLAGLVHPHHDKFHLIHHLMANIPWFNTAEAHKLLLALPVYNEMHHCDGYFLGEHSLVCCWSKQCPACSKMDAKKS